MVDAEPQPGVDYPRNWHEFVDWFPDDDACLSYLERLRWGGGYLCRFCGQAGAGSWPVRRGLRRCSVCRSESSVTAGTIFPGSRLPLTSWFAAIWYVVNQKQGVSALGRKRVLGLGSYQTAWTWLHKLRRAMVIPGRERLFGPVEVDDTLIGTRRSGTFGRGDVRKALVAIAVEHRVGGRPGGVRMRRIPNASTDGLSDVVVHQVEPGAEVQTDAWNGYNHRSLPGFLHHVVNLAASGDPAHAAMPQVHRVASLRKRWLLGTHQGAISHSHLDYDLDEFTFRFNRRGSRHRGLLFYRLIEGALLTAPKPYSGLIAPRDVSAA